MHRLRAVIPTARMAPYDTACAGTGVNSIVLYRWASAVALAVFDDLATLEVAMRSAMARELVLAYGPTWYRRTDVLDDGTLKLVDDAWRVGRLGQLNGPPDMIHGKLVATLMFGFWVKMLGRGTYQGQGASRSRRIYDTTLWKPALRNAFPNVGALDRAVVETAARRVQALRNRIAHHEHIIWGVPMAGELNPDGSIVRLPVSEVHEALLSLAGYVDAGLEAWMRQHTQVTVQLALCPVSDRTRFLL